MQDYVITASMSYELPNGWTGYRNVPSFYVSAINDERAEILGRDILESMIPHGAATRVAWIGAYPRA